MLLLNREIKCSYKENNLLKTKMNRENSIGGTVLNSSKLDVPGRWCLKVGEAGR